MVRETLISLSAATLMIAMLSSSVPRLFAQNITDIDLNYNRKAIRFLVDKEIISEYPDGTFRPYADINRAELAKILVKANGIGVVDDSSHDCFPDVKKQWFASSVCYAKSQGWVGGYPDGTFKPEKNVTTLEAIKMIVLSQGHNTTYRYTAPEDDLYSEYSSYFSDTYETMWYSPYLAVAVQKNIIERGYDVGTYYLGAVDNIQRGALAEMIYRALYIKENALEKYLTPAAAQYKPHQETCTFDATSPANSTVTYTNRPTGFFFTFPSNPDWGFGLAAPFEENENDYPIRSKRVKYEPSKVYFGGPPISAAGGSNPVNFDPCTYMRNYRFTLSILPPLSLSEVQKEFNDYQDEAEKEYEGEWVRDDSAVLEIGENDVFYSQGGIVARCSEYEVVGKKNNYSFGECCPVDREKECKQDLMNIIEKTVFP